MTTAQDVVPVPLRVFADAMTRLACSLAVVTARCVAGEPRGLLVSSFCSYSAQPPSVLVGIGQSSRSYPTLIECAEFGLHVLGHAHRHVAEVFASRENDKFAGLSWSWDGPVPRLDTVPVYLRCTVARVFHHGDHVVVIGDVTRADLSAGDPLVYHRRRYDWRLRHI